MRVRIRIRRSDLVVVSSLTLLGVVWFGVGSLIPDATENVRLFCYMQMAGIGLGMPLNLILTSLEREPV